VRGTGLFCAVESGMLRYDTGIQHYIMQWCATLHAIVVCYVTCYSGVLRYMI
jgi:hypothetical protein